MPRSGVVVNDIDINDRRRRRRVETGTTKPRDDASIIISGIGDILFLGLRLRYS